MNCEVCGAQMNHHADKLVYVEDAGATRERVAEMHACPECGHVDMRMAD